MSQVSEVIVTQNGAVLEVLLDRPKKKNSLTFAMYDALTAAFMAAQENPTVRVGAAFGRG